VLWLTTAAIGDAPTAVLACAGLLLGVWLLARGPRREAVAAPAQAEPETPAPAVATPVPSAVVGTEATTFRQGTIHLADEPEPEPAAQGEAEADAEPEPGSDAEPQPAAEVAPAPAPAPPVSPMPEFPPTNFRQGRIRVGGLDRGKPRDG
jgi:hypothetical protein